MAPKQAKGGDINAAVDRAVAAMMTLAGVDSKDVTARAREGVDRKLPSRIAALRQWDRLTAKGLDQWDEARRVGLPAYDHPRDDMRGGLDRYRSDLRDTPWKAFFLRWVEPEITKQYDAKEEAGASPTRQKYETSPGKKYDLVEALDKGVIAMLRAAGLSAAGVTAKSQSGKDKKLETRVAALREWDRLRAAGLHEWDSRTQLGLPEYDLSSQGLRGGPQAHLVRCDVAKPWKDFYQRWVLPELERQAHQHIARVDPTKHEAMMSKAEAILTPPAPAALAAHATAAAASAQPPASLDAVTAAALATCSLDEMVDVCDLNFDMSEIVQLVAKFDPHGAAGGGR